MRINEVDSPEELIVKLTEKIEELIDVHFGIRAGQLSDALIKAVLKEIIQNYSSLTLFDIVHAYERAHIEKNDWRNVTKREILEPVIAWNNQKQAIQLEFQRFQKEVEELEKVKQDELEFRNHSMILYNEAIESGVWCGDAFNASSIAKHIAQFLDEDVKSELWNLAKLKKERLDALKKVDLRTQRILIDSDFVGYSVVRIYSDLIVKKAIEQKISI